MKASTVTHQYIVCPYCGMGETRIDHLNVGDHFGPWHCHEIDCGKSYTGVRTEDGAEIELIDELCKRALIELAYVNDPKLKIVVEGLLFKNTKWGMLGDPEYPAHWAYYYDEHTCPVNYLGVHKVSLGTDDDPHGVFQFVRALLDEETRKVLNE